MKLFELKSLIESIVSEEINKEQLNSVAKTLHIPVGKLNAWVKGVDPTSRQSFSVWILRMLKNQQIRFEDSLRVGSAINRFIQLRNANRIEDIMRFPTIHELETRMDQLEGQGSKRQGFAGVNPLTLPGVEILEKRPDITFYKVTNPSSLAKMGEGTKWCTRFSFNKSISTAKGYIDRYGYLVIGYKDGKPYVQYNPDYSQVMDVNDVSFHHVSREIAKQLNLPPPEIIKRPLPKIDPSKYPPLRTTKKREFKPETPAQTKLRSWLKFTTQRKPEWEKFIKSKSDRKSTKGKDIDYEQRVARAITRSTHPFHIDRVMYYFVDYAKKEITGERSPVIEKAILEKDFKPTMVAGKGGRGSGSRTRIPGIDGIIFYVKNNIKSNWPEFEQKIQNDAANSVKYYTNTGLNPDNIPDGIVKDMVLFVKFIKDKHITPSKEKFEASIVDFISRARNQFKYGQFSPILYNVIIPYMELVKKPLIRIVGSKLYNILTRSNATFRGVVKRTENGF